MLVERNNEVGIQQMITLEDITGERVIERL